MSSTPTLWERVLTATDHALQCGELEPIPTRAETFDEAGIPFQLQIVDALRRKREDKQQRALSWQPGTDEFNPFLPYNRDLFVADLGKSHVCLLNKYPVLRHHLLVVTRAFAHQEALLDEADFRALREVMLQVDGLGFYNGGVVAGASQKHKHLQLAPYPLAADHPRAPIEALFDTAVQCGDFWTAPGLPFRHAMARFNAGLPEATQLADTWQALYRAVGLEERHGRQSAPYNMLMTRQWMMAVPRAEEFFDTISVNAIGFAGGLLAMDAREMALMKEAGPLAILRHVGQASVKR